METERQVITLQDLPLELISLIALSTDSTTAILSLCRASKSFHEGLLRAQTFRKLVASRRDAADDWNLSLVSERAADDAKLWARFAKADELANLTAFVAVLGHFPKLDRVYHWIGELAVTKHPIIKQDFWREVTDRSGTDPPQYIFAKIMALLHGAELGRSPDTSSPLVGRGAGLFAAIKFFSRSPTTSSRLYLWALRDTLIVLYNTIHMRGRVWPYTNHAIHPDISLPKIDRMPLSTISNAQSYDIPVPFASSCHVNDSQSWVIWYKLHTQALLASVFEGEWQGYYSSVNATSDPPMTGIFFQQVRNDQWEDGRISFVANNCQDGIGRFSLRGQIWKDKDNGEIKLEVGKQYHNQHFWSWTCRLTPFGIVGFWGVFVNAHIGSRETHGTVWLWKKEWC